MKEQDSNKRIVKNTLVLYVRMLFLMLISFYTSRVVLNALGVVDYGVYNVVGGIVGFMAFINSSMSLATNRFLAFAIGKNDIALLNKTFNMSLEIHFLISLIVILLAETVGLWYFNNYLNIPAESVSAAMWVYQLSIVSCALSIITVPYIALATANEDMSIYAYFSILEGILKLIVAILLTVIIYNKLKLYAVMMFGVCVISLFCWWLYSTKKYKYIKVRYIWDKSFFFELFSFIGWQFIGSFSWLLRNQGVELVLNFYFGPALNAAKTISNQVNGGISTLVNNFQKAVNPQLVKNFASDDFEKLNALLFRSCKLSFVLIFIFAFPIFLIAEPLLTYWLNIVPEYAVIFVKLSIIVAITDSFSGTLHLAAIATGQMKKYTIYVTTITISQIIWVVLAFKLGMNPQWMYYIEIALSITVFFARLTLVHRLINVSINNFLKQVTFREILAGFAATVILLPSAQLFSESFLSMLFLLSLAFLISSLSSFYFCLNKNERTWIREPILAKIHR